MLALAPSAALASEAPEISFSGALDYQFAFSDADQQAPGHGTVISAVGDRSELVWEAEGVADNGLTYGADVHWRYAAGVFDEAYMYFGGGWGLLHLGADDDVVDDMATGGHDVQAHSEGFDGEFGDYYVQVGGASALGTTGSSGVSNKIAYYTPAFAGFSAGLSFTPQNGQAFQAAGTDTAPADNVVEGSIAYGGAFGGAAIGLSAGYRTGDANTNVSGTTAERIGAFRLGAKLGVGPVELGLGYGDNGDSACQENTPCDAGYNWQAGLGYDYGRGRIALGYATGENTTAANLEEEITIYNLSADYTIAEGLVGYADLVRADSSNGTAGPAGENEGTVLLLGSAIFF